MKSLQHKIEIDCKNFRAVKLEEGKTTCSYYQKPLCTLPQNFLCIEAEKRKEVKQREYHSYSSITSFLSCQRKYYYRYIMKIEPIEIPVWAERGRLFHFGLEQYYSEGIISEISIETEISAIVSPVLKAYIELYNDKREGLSIEQKYVISNPPLLSYIDILDGNTIIDHKFSAKEPNILSLGYQASIYHRVIPEAEKFIVNFIKVPYMKKGEKETLNEFANRIYKAVKKEPNKYFNRTIYNLKSEFYLFDYQIEKIIEVINSMVGKHIDYYFMNPSSCSFGGCSYEDICIRKTIDESKYIMKGG